MFPRVPAGRSYITVPFRTHVYMFLFSRKGKEPSHGLRHWYENEDFNTEYFPSWSKCHDKLGDGCTIDFPIRLHMQKLKWSTRTFIKQDDGTVMPKARSFEEVSVVNLVKKRC